MFLLLFATVVSLAAILGWLTDHPELTGMVLSMLIWPLVSAGLNFVFRPHSAEEGAEREKRSPRWAGFLRATRGAGVDPAKLLAGAVQMVTGKLKLPPPPPGAPGAAS